MMNVEVNAATSTFGVRHSAFDIHFFLRPSMIFKNKRVRIVASENALASASILPMQALVGGSILGPLLIRV